MKKPGLLLIASFLMAAASASAAQVALRADFPDAAVKEPLPVSGGIPFPKGALKSVEEIRLLGAANQEIPCQVTQLAVWPDGSVKWAFIDAILEPGAGQA